MIKININFFYVLQAEQEVKLEDIKLNFVAVLIYIAPPLSI